VKGRLRIEEMYAYVVMDDDNTEGVPAFQARDGMMMPMMGADMAKADMLLGLAQRAATQLGKRVTLVRFSVREEIKVIEP
jgi:hypothetical protein